MKLPFTTEQFLQVFRDYNLAVWPIQVLFVVTAIAIIYFLIKRKSYSDSFINGTLGFYWIWMGLVYHILYFSSINKAAIVFGTVFIVQGIMFIYFGLFKKELNYEYQAGLKGITSVLLFLYALIFYPLLGYSAGHIYPYNPTFGLPCPTTIFTFGVLLQLVRISKKMFVIPVIWTVIGFTAALNLGVYEDVGLLVAGIVTVLILILNKNVGGEVRGKSFV